MEGDILIGHGDLILRKLWMINKSIQNSNKLSFYVVGLQQFLQ